MIPTGVPFAAPSVMLLAAAFVSIGVDGLTLVTAMLKVAAHKGCAQNNSRAAPNKERNDKRSFTLIVLPSPFVATAWPPGKLQLGKGPTQKKSAADEHYLYMRLRNVLLKRHSH